MEFSCLDDLSGTIAEMQTSINPYPSLSESLATTGAGEIQRLRYQIGNLFGLTYWFRNDENINFAHAGGLNVVQGAGSGRHVTAVGYHSWAGTARFPAIAGRYVHTTGIFWPAAHHFAVSVDPAVDRDKGGVEVLRLHFTALQFHHTVALRFAHSNAGLAAWQYPHITALQVRRPQQAPDGTTPFTPDISDQIILGHRGVALQLQGASLTPTANRLIGWGPSSDYIEGKVISGSGVTISHQAGQLVFGGSALTAFILRPEGAVFPSATDAHHQAAVLAKHSGTNSVSYALMFTDRHIGSTGLTHIGVSAHFYAVIPTGTASFGGAVIEVFSYQDTHTTGHIGWHIGTRTVASGEAWDAAYTINTIYPQAVNGTADTLLRQTEDLTITGWAAGEVLQIFIRRIVIDTAIIPVPEATSFVMAVIRLR